MDRFHNGAAIRLKSYHDNYLHADEDGESVTQDGNGLSNNAWWIVEYVRRFDGDYQKRWTHYNDSFESNKTIIIRLRNRYGRYLTASNRRFLLGATGRKVVQTLPSQLDSSVEWEAIWEGNRVKLKTRDGDDRFLRANGGLPPWRNSVTHDKPYRTSSQDLILWDVV